MNHLIFHFDPISPFVHLAFHRLPEALEGCSYTVEYRPVLFAALLKHWGHKGPAEIEPKRAWTFRHVQWLAQQQGTLLQTPLQHPFNPLPLLRLAVAARPNRHVVETILAHVWQGNGADANDPQRLAALRERLALHLPEARNPDADDVKAELRAYTEQAVADGLFGVPMLTWQGRNFWGLDALPMLRDAMQGGAWFEGPAWDDAGRPRGGVVRQ